MKSDPLHKRGVGRPTPKPPSLRACTVTKKVIVCFYNLGEEIF